MDLGLAGKVALVTGGSRGIGRAIALALAGEGCKVAICARGGEQLARALAEIHNLGTEAFAEVADVRSRREVEAFVAKSAEALGGVDILINNVGGSAGGTLLESSEEDWAETFDLNLFHAVRTTRAVLPHMRERGGGAVVIVSSISGWKPGPRAQYGSAKAAEIFLAGALAIELAEYNVRINAVAPGSIFFPGGGWERFSGEQPERYEAFRGREFPAGRLGSAEEVADVVAFLVSPRAAWINGAMVPVDGAQGRPSAF
jgi:3-oxoacyl-[acyl-carrier protein] reductase